MNIATWTLIFSFFGLLTSCQVKETSGGSGLISGHAPATNAFTLNTPTADVLITGDVLTLTLSFPYLVTVDTTGGTPGLGLTIGATTRNAAYASGTGTKTLTFTYTIAVADNDSDGITVTGLSLNGGTLTFDNNGVTTNCSTTLTEKTFSTLLVDNTAPSITAFSQANLPGFYHVGDTLSFLMTFSEKVYVAGTPRFQVDFTTGGSVYATYAGGSGTTSLSFTYTITNSVADSNGYTFTSPIDLNSGTIVDGAGNASSIDFSAYTAAAQTASANMDLDGRLPYVDTVTPPSNGTYVAAQNLDVSLTFDRAVNVTGTPYIILTIGAASRQAVYTSGSGTTTLIFRYTTIPGDVDADGITVASTITQNGGTITGAAAPTNSFFTASGNNALSVPSTTGVIVGAVQPAPTSVMRNLDSTNAIWGTATDNVWIIGQQLLITVGYNTGIYVGQTGGTPRIPITIGVTTKYATYLSGGDGQTAIVFAYTIEEGLSDIDGTIDIGNIELNGGTMTDSANTNATLTLPSSSLTSTKVDGIKPTISSVTAPADGTYSNVNVASMDFTVTWSESVDYSSTAAAAAYLTLNIGGSSVNAIYASGDQTATIVHTPSSLGTTNDADGIGVASPFAGTGTVKDQAGNTATSLIFAVPVTTGILVDTTAPSVSSISAQPPNATYIKDAVLDFEVTFSESVTVNVNSDYPRIALTFTSYGNVSAYLVPTSSGTATTHTFRYTVVTNDLDANGIALATSVSTTALGYIKDAGLNNLSGTYVAPNTAGILIDAVAPTVSSASTTAGAYVAAGDGNSTITITVNMSENVLINNAGGDPYLTLVIDTGNVNATYNAGASTASVLKFDYPVDGAVDMDLNGLSLSPSSIQLPPGSTITDAATNEANTSIGSVTGLSTTYIVPHATVWLKGTTATNRSGFTVKPTISSVPATTASPYWIFDGISDTIGFSGLGNLHAVYMAFRTPAAVAAPQGLIMGHATLDNADIDMTTGDQPDIRCETTVPAYSATATTTHENAFALGTNYQCEFLFGGIGAASANPFVDNTFSGRVSEILIFEAPLSVDQKTSIYNYIKGAY